MDLLINCNSVLFNDLLKSRIFNLEAIVESKMHEIDLIVFIMLNLLGAFLDSRFNSLTNYLVGNMAKAVRPLYGLRFAPKTSPKKAV